jgi:hypothetical protein
VETVAVPVATPMVLWPWVLANTTWPVAVLVMRTSG